MVREPRDTRARSRHQLAPSARQVASERCSAQAQAQRGQASFGAMWLTSAARALTAVGNEPDNAPRLIVSSSATAMEIGGQKNIENSTKKTVVFDPTPKVRYILACSFANREARKEPWVLAAVNRQRFAERIERISAVLTPVLERALSRTRHTA